MSVLLADIDATCAALGYNGEEKYEAEPDAVQGLKHLIWILRRDLDNHEYRRHLGRAKVLQTDLVPMLPHYVEDEDYADVLIRLLVILTNPALLLYREGLPKDGPGRKIYLELVDILQGYKEAFTDDFTWASLAIKLQKVLEISWGLRHEEQGLLIERVLVLVRNVLHVPANPEAECRADNDASLHDRVIWALHRSGMLDLVLYILSSADENQYHLHALEIVCLMYREQTAASLADASLQRSAAEKHRDEQELIAVRRRERQRLTARPPPGRHSRFGGTYVLQNVKSVSDKDIICHQSLERAIAIDFDREKTKQKRSHRVVSEETASHRRSAFSVRLCLREYCIEVLRSAYNTLVRQVRRVLERNSDSASHDDSYLLWAIRFFMEFNRLSGLQLHLVSESLSVQCFHWVLTRIQHDMDMITCDKKQSRLWARRLHVGIQTFRELLLSLLALQKLQDEKAQALFDMLLNNICYVLEYRETVLHLLMNYNETHSTKAYLRDIIETANIFIKIMEKFCKGSVVVQEKRRHHKKGGRKSRPNSQKANKKEDENLEDIWATLAPQVSTLLVKELNLPEEDQPIPFDAASEKSIEDQKEDCMLKIHKLLREENIEHAIALMRAGREVWPENDCFGAILAAPEDELMILREIFLSNLDSGKPVEEPVDADTENSEDNEEDDEPAMVEKDFRFEDFAKRLVNPKVVRACTIVLYDWQSIPTKILKSAVTILYRIAYGFHCPAMLFQATLFKIFQQVFDAPKETHQEELRRLGVFVIRKFVETAKKNEKIYAELLLYKTLKEANDIETGYADTEHGSIKNAWTEEQENELRILFEENQNNPQNDQDVIDWILDNLIDKTRTRRGVMKKLKEMGLVFKKATKKSLAAPSKNLWQHEEDEKLRALYDEHRLDEACLDRITEALGGCRSKNQIIKRMIQIHLIADRSEVVRNKSKARKPRKARITPQSEEDASEPEMLEENAPSARKFKPKKAPRRDTKIRKIVRTPLDLAIVKGLISEIDEKFTEAVEWLKDSLLDAAEDIEEPSEDPDDGVPLLPLQPVQKEAMEDTQFKKLLISIGIQPPIEEMENYWRIPAYLTAADLQMRVNVISGTHEEPPLGSSERDDDGDGDVDVDGDDETGAEEQDLGNNESSDEDDLHENFLSKRRERLNNLVFNKSDNEDEPRKPLEPKARRRQKDTKTNRDVSSGKTTTKRGKLNIEAMVKDSSGLEEDDDNDDEATILHIESKNLRQRLAELTESDNSDEEEDGSKKPTHARTRIRPNVLESDSSADEFGATDLLTSNPNGDLPATSGSSGDQSHRAGGENATVIEAIDDQSQGSNKRARSGDSDDDGSDDNVVFKRKKPNAGELQKRKLAIVDDDDSNDE